MTVAESNAALRRVQAAISGDPYGVVTIAGARAAYVRGDIEADEFERRVGEILAAEDEGREVVGVAWLAPGERVIPTQRQRRDRRQPAPD